MSRERENGPPNASPHEARRAGHCSNDLQQKWKINAFQSSCQWFYIVLVLFDPGQNRL